MNTKLHCILAGIVPDINEQVKAINHGGCGHFAYELSKALLVRGIFSEPVLVAYGYDAENVTTMIDKWAEGGGINEAYVNMFKEGRYHNTCNGHIALRVEGRLYDSNGLCSRAAISEGIYPDVMEAFLSKNCWNDCFENCNDHDIPTAIDMMHNFFDTALMEVCYE